MTDAGLNFLDITTSNPLRAQPWFAGPQNVDIVLNDRRRLEAGEISKRDFADTIKAVGFCTTPDGLLETPTMSSEIGMISY